MNLLMFTALAVILSLALLMVGHFLPSRALELEKKTPYECGFDPMNSARLPFSFRFFLMAILFLMFDLEIALLFPTMPSANLSMKSLMLFSTAFMLILAGGLAYEWDQGGLEWAE